MKHGLSETCYAFFLTLANPTRLAILEFFHEGPRSVNEISDALNQKQSMISHNLQRLDECGFVFSKRRNKERLYSLNTETVEPLFKIFAYHAEKYCPTGGKCLTERGLRRRKKKEASTPMYLMHH